MSALTTLDRNTVQEAAQALARARIMMMGTTGAIFITSVCFGLKQQFTRDVPRAGTDGTTIYYNPEWFCSLTQKQQVGLVVHETWHVCLNHCKLMKYSRLGTRDPKLFNVAADAVINNFIIDSGMELPPNGIYMPEHRGLSTERVYDLLAEKEKNGEPIPQLGDESRDILDPAEDEGDMEEGTAESGPTIEMPIEIRELMVRASLSARLAGEKPGNMPGELQLVLDNITNPKLPWRKLVQRYTRARAKTLYDFTRPNRRYFPAHYLPSRGGYTLQSVLMAIDMSGSVTDEQVSKFIDEVCGVLLDVAPKSLQLLEFDTSVRAVTPIRTKHQLQNHVFTGRGGTIIDPVIEYANEHRTDLVVIFTDGEFYGPHVKSKAPVLWIIYDNPNFTCDQGKVIHVDLP